MASKKKKKNQAVESDNTIDLEKHRKQQPAEPVEIPDDTGEKTIDLAKRRKQKARSKMKNGDFMLTALVFGLVIFGVVMVFSASYYYSISKNGTPYYYLIRDIIWATLGTVAMFLMAAYDYHKMKKWTPFVLMISTGLLVVLLFPQLPFVVTINNSSRWIGVGPITIMPGEIAKVAGILAASVWLSKKPGMVRDFFHGIVPMICLMGLLGGLIAVNNMVTAITVITIIVGIMFIAGIRMVYLGGLLGLGVAAGILMVITDTKGYRLRRILSFTNPFADEQGSGYQVVQGLLALGSGGLTGVGLGKSMQKTLYLPEPQNDFIYAIIGEEFGFIGLMLLLMVYLLLIWRCTKITINAPDTLGTLLGSGITIMLSMQVIMNVLVVTSFMPPTGVVLPFISWGGNALLIFMGSMGVMLNISRQKKKTE